MERWYKILNAKGESLHGKFTWSLPTAKAPGAWHEIPAEETLVACQVGFHLTNNPREHFASGLRVYLAEHRGEVLPGVSYRGDEIVCRAVRIVRRIEGEELRALLGVPAKGPLPKGGAAPGEPPPSAALLLVKHVWANAQEKTGHSYTRLNTAMGRAVALAIEAGLRFDKDDFRAIYEGCNGGYWFGESGGEQFYAAAVKYANDSACQAFEAFVERPPFIFEGARLAVESTLTWDRRHVHVTSFGDEHLIACVRKYEDGGHTKIVKRYTITLAELRAAEKARKAARKKKATSAEVAA